MQVLTVQRNAFWLAGPRIGAETQTWGFHAAPEPEFKAPAKDRRGGVFIFVVG